MGNFSLEGARKDLEDLLTGFRSKSKEQEQWIASGKSPIYGEAVAIPDPVAMAVHAGVSAVPGGATQHSLLPEANLHELFGPLLGGPIQDVYNRLREKLPHWSPADLMALLASLGMGRNVMASNMERQFRYYNVEPKTELLQAIRDETMGGRPSGETGPVTLFKELLGKRKIAGPIPLTAPHAPGEPVRQMDSSTRKMLDLTIQAPPSSPYHDPGLDKTLLVDPTRMGSYVAPATKTIVATTPGAAGHEIGHLKADPRNTASTLLGYNPPPETLAARKEFLNDLYHTAPDRLSQEWGKILEEELKAPALYAADRNTGMMVSQSNWGRLDPRMGGRGSRLESWLRMQFETDANANSYLAYKQKYGKDKALEMVRSNVENSLFNYAYGHNTRLRSFIDKAVEPVTQRPPSAASINKEGYFAADKAIREKAQKLQFSSEIELLNDLRGNFAAKKGH